MSSQTDIFTSLSGHYQYEIQRDSKPWLEYGTEFSKVRRLRIKWGSWDKNGSNVTVRVWSE
jgi:hypothetical protein